MGRSRRTGIEIAKRSARQDVNIFLWNNRIEKILRVKFLRQRQLYNDAGVGFCLHNLVYGVSQLLTRNGFVESIEPKVYGELFCNFFLCPQKRFALCVLADYNCRKRERAEFSPLLF